MLDTGGPELQVVKKTKHPISLEADTKVILTPDQDKPATSNLLPINYHELSKVSNILVRSVNFMDYLYSDVSHFCILSFFSISYIWIDGKFCSSWLN